MKGKITNLFVFAFLIFLLSGSHAGADSRTGGKEEILPPSFRLPELPDVRRISSNQQKRNEEPHFDADGKARLEVDLYTHPVVPNNLLRISLGRDLSFFPSEQYRIYFPGHQMGIRDNILVRIGDTKLLFKYMTDKEHNIYLQSWNLPHFFIRRDGERLSVMNLRERLEYLFSSIDSGYTWNIDEIRDIDFKGRNIRCEYNENDLMKSIILPDNSKYTIEYNNAGNVAKVVNPDGILTEIGWDDKSQPREIKSWMLSEHPFYRIEKTKTGKKSKNPGILVSHFFTECGTDGKLMSLVTSNGEKYSIEYRSDKNEGEKTSYFCGVMSYPDGSRKFRTVIWKPKDKDDEKSGKTLEICDGTVENGGKGGEVLKVVERRLYEKKGNNYTETEIETSGARSSVAYNPDGMASGYTNARGDTTAYAYNGKRQRTKIAYPDGAEENFTYNDKFQLMSKADSSGQTMRYAYDSLSRLCEIRGFEGVTKYQYLPETGMPAETILPNGSVHKFGWDSLCRMTSHLLPDSTTVEYKYAAGSGIVTEMNAKSSDGKTETKKYFYSPEGLLEGIQYPGGEMEKFHYKGCDLVKYENRNGISTEYAYDSSHRKVSENTSDGKKTIFKYDVQGNLLSIQDSGRTFKSEFDAYGRIIKRTSPDKSWVAYSYDETGRRVIKERYSDRTESLFKYDSRDRLVSTLGDHSDGISYKFNVAGQLVSTTVTGGGAPEGKAKTTSYFYDELGRKVKTVFPDGSEEKIVYSGNDEARIRNRQVTYTKYDVMGRISVVSEYPMELFEKAATKEEKRKVFENNIVREYVYNLFGDLVEIKDRKRPVTAMSD